MFIRFFLLAFFVTAVSFQTPAQENQLWFSKPAENWNEALPIGNGRLGAMIFGGVEQERLQLNEESVWTGKPDDFVNPEARKSLPEIRKLLFDGKYAAANTLAQKNMMGNKKIPSTYQTLGDLTMDMDHSGNTISNYYRSLDLETAIATVLYSVGNVTYSREYFSSAPDHTLVVNLSASSPESISFSLQLKRMNTKAEVCSEGDELVLREQTGDGTGVKLVSRVKVVNEGGSIRVDSNGSLTVKNASRVMLYLTAATNYWGTDPEKVSADQLANASAKTYSELRKRHIDDYQQYFKRVEFSLGPDKKSGLPVNERLEKFRNGTADQALISLYYQFGRYLLISSSRPGDLPSNLQGIWADGLHPPWEADYHININIQMNYWPAEITNLSEMHTSFIDFLEPLRLDGLKTAKEMYGVQGAVAHFTTDAWHLTEPYGQTQWAMWPMGLAWSAQHVWEHFLFTGDTVYLRKTYPIMKDAAIFCMNFLIKNPNTNLLVSGPSISPENTFKTKEGEVATMVMGPTMDHMIIRDLLNNTRLATDVLKEESSFQKRIDRTLKQLAPLKLGSDGRIMEWTEEFEEAEPGHRHISHLFALYPGKEINRNTPELMTAARKTIDHRLANGGGHTGWSRAWIINFFARLHDGDAAYENLQALLTKSTLPNLFDTHPPFQIDGNFGATAGITEMLLQSHAGEIEILPALPDEWTEGFINGVCARGGFELDIVWEKGKLKSGKIISKSGNPLVLRYGEKVIRIETEKGKEYSFDGNLIRTK